MEDTYINGLPSGSYTAGLRKDEVNQGIFNLDDEVNQETASLLLTEMRTYKRNNPLRVNSLMDYNTKQTLSRVEPKKVQMRIMSPGGDIYHAFAIYDAMKTMSKEGYKIEATVEGCAASAAAMIILQAADFRKSMENARFLLHEARRWVFMTVERGSDVEDEHKELQALHKIMFDILAHRTGKSYEAIAKVIQRREIWMSAKEAKEFGLIDEIV